MHKILPITWCKRVWLSSVTLHWETRAKLLNVKNTGVNSKMPPPHSNLKKINLFARNMSLNLQKYLSWKIKLKETKHNKRLHKWMEWLKTSKSMKVSRSHNSSFLLIRNLMLQLAVSCATSDTRWVYLLTKNSMNLKLKRTKLQLLK